MAKFLKHVSGNIQEESTVTTSAGAGDVGKIPALNASGVLDASVVNSKTSSAGVSDAGKLAALDAAGKLSQTMMPVGIGADTLSVITSEAVSAGDLVNLWNDGGTGKARKADATIAGKEAHGFVLAGAGSGAPVDVYFEGTNTGMSGMTAGVQFLSTTAGTSSTTPPAGTGNVVQRVGFAASATSMNFQSGTPIILA